jgi:hypothetical protein
LFRRFVRDLTVAVLLRLLDEDGYDLYEDFVDVRAELVLTND